MTTSQEQLRQLTGATAYDRDGDKLGRIGQVYYDDNTDQPKWITVNTGLFGMERELRAAAGCPVRRRPGHAWPTTRPPSRTHPTSTRSGHLALEEEQQLYRHYGLDYGGGVSGERAGRHERRDDSAAGVVGDATRRDLTDRTEGHDTSGPTTDNAMTRSEEHLRVGHRDPGGRPGAAAQARGDRARSRSPCRCRTRRSRLERRADHRRQPGRRLRRPGDLRGGARGHPARRAPGGDHRGRARSSGSGWAPRPSPSRRPSAARSARSRSSSTTTPAPAATGAAESTNPAPLAGISTGGERGSSDRTHEERRNGTSADDPASTPLRLRSGGGVVTRCGQRDPGAAPTRCKAGAHRVRAGTHERIRRGKFRRGRPHRLERSGAAHRSRRLECVAAGRAGGGAHADPADRLVAGRPAGRSRKAPRTTSAILAGGVAFFAFLAIPPALIAGADASTGSSPTRRRSPARSQALAGSLPREAQPLIADQLNTLRQRRQRRAEHRPGRLGAGARCGAPRAARAT